MLFVIPAFNPGSVLVSLVQDLSSASKKATFMIVDDGSDTAASEKVFDALLQIKGVSVIRHSKNRGKGAALKTAIRAAQEHGAPMIVTADADGQHASADIVRIAEIASGSDRLHIGARQFGPDVPLRSRFGNLLTRWIFNFVLRSNVSDTQSGLRAIPAKFFPTLLSITLDRYDFESEALLLIARDGPVEEIPIATIYEPGNPTSHFNPVKDSLRIYYVLFRYGLTVPIIALMDLVAFWKMSTFLDPLVAFLSVRMVTIGIYFLAMRKLVFRSKAGIKPQVARYAALCLLNVCVATALLDYTNRIFGFSPILGYLLASTLMLGLNFLIMRNMIFVPESSGGERND